MAKRKAKTKTAAVDLTYIAEDLRGLAVPIEELVVDPRNARTHDEGNLAAIAASLSQFGMVKPIVVNRATKVIEAGNGTYLAAKRLGWSHLAVVFVEHDPASQTGFALADNRTAEMAGWNDVLLAELMGELAASSSDLYDSLLLAELCQTPAGGSTHGDGGEEEAPDGYGETLGVLIKCRDKATQERWFQRAKKEGLRARRVKV